MRPPAFFAGYGENAPLCDERWLDFKKTGIRPFLAGARMRRGGTETLTEGSGVGVAWVSDRENDRRSRIFKSAQHRFLVVVLPPEA